MQKVRETIKQDSGVFASDMDIYRPSLVGRKLNMT
jgi:hypothetical protein